MSGKAFICLGLRMMCPGIVPVLSNYGDGEGDPLADRHNQSSIPLHFSTGVHTNV